MKKSTSTSAMEPKRALDAGQWDQWCALIKTWRQILHPFNAVVGSMLIKSESKQGTKKASLSLEIYATPRYFKGAAMYALNYLQTDPWLKKAQKDPIGTLRKYEQTVANAPKEQHMCLQLMAARALHKPLLEALNAQQYEYLQTWCRKNDNQIWITRASIQRSIKGALNVLLEEYAHSLQQQQHLDKSIIGHSPSAPHKASRSL